MKRAKGIMTLDDLSLAASRIEDYAGPFSGQVHLSGYGEPLLDRELPAKVSAVAQRWPKCEPFISTTLGVEVEESWLKDLCGAGLRMVEVSFYAQNPEAYREMTGRDRLALSRRNLHSLASISQLLPNPLRVVVKTHMEGVEEMLQANPHQGLTCLLKELDGKVEFLGDRRLHNYGQARSYRPAKTQACSITGGYRASILQVTWDLNVIPCCFDFDTTMVLGNLRETSLQAILNGSSLCRLRQAHLSGDLSNYPICQECCTR